MKIFGHDISGPVFAIFYQIGFLGHERRISIPTTSNITANNVQKVVRKAAEEHKEQLRNKERENYTIGDFYADGKRIKIWPHALNVDIAYSQLFRQVYDLDGMNRSQLIKLAKELPVLSPSSQYPGRYEFIKVSKKTNADLRTEIRAHLLRQQQMRTTN